MFTKQPTMDIDIEFDIKLLATEYYEGTVCNIPSDFISFQFFLYFFIYFFPSTTFISFERNDEKKIP